jgi:hypothetical protein
MGECANRNKKKMIEQTTVPTEAQLSASSKLESVAARRQASIKLAW